MLSIMLFWLISCANKPLNSSRKVLRETSGSSVGIEQLHRHVSVTSLLLLQGIVGRCGMSMSCGRGFIVAVVVDYVGLCPCRISCYRSQPL
jgi:hypothetical protein